MRTRPRETVARETASRVGKGQHPPTLPGGSPAARPVLATAPSLPRAGWARGGCLPPHLGGGGVRGGPHRFRPRATNPDRPPRPTAPSPTRASPPPPPTATRPPRPPSPRDISILSRFSLLRAFGGGGGVAVAPTSRAPNRFMAGDAAAASEAGSREGRSRRPSSASHSRTQTSCSAERARAPPASSPSHPRRREGRGGGATETSRRPERPTRNWPLAALAGLGLLRSGAAASIARRRRGGAAVLAPGRSAPVAAAGPPAPPQPSLKHLAWPCCVLGGGGWGGGAPAAERLGTPLCNAASGGWTDSPLSSHVRLSKAAVTVLASS